MVSLAFAAAARAAGSVYTANFGVNGSGNTVSQYDIDLTTGALLPKSTPLVSTDGGPRIIAISPDGKSAYATNRTAHTISQYNIDPMTGALSPKTPATVDVGPIAAAPFRDCPEGIAITPDGKSAYVGANCTPNGITGTVSQFDINATDGTLSPKTPATVPTGIANTASDAHSIVVTPDGKSAYVTNDCGGCGSDTVSQYNIDSTTGALSPKSPATVAAVGGPLGAAVTPDGMSAYFTVGNNVLQFNIGSTDGTLSPKSPASVNGGSGADGIVVSPDGRSAYVAAQGSGFVAQYNIDALTGALSPKTPATVPVGSGASSGPRNLAVSPDGASLYVTAQLDGTVAQYDIAPLTGLLSPKSPATVASGPRPWGIAVGPLPLPPPKDPTTTGVSCSPGTVSVGSGTTCTATVTDTAATPTTPTGSVSFGSDTSGGTFSNPGSSCTLSGSGASASCSVTYTPGQVGSGTHKITATYAGDSTHATSSGSTTVTVTPSTTTTGVSCSPGTVSVGSGTTCTATVTDTAATPTTPTGSVSFGSDTSGGTFSNPGSSCTLSGSGASASCSVTYTPGQVGSGTHKITATYAGDSTHATSTGSTTVAVTPSTTATSTKVACREKPRAETWTCAATVSNTGTGTRPTGTVSFASNSPRSSFNGNPCKLSGSGASATCSVTYKPGPRPRLQTITATYSGDSTHTKSSGTTTIDTS